MELNREYSWYNEKVGETLCKRLRENGFIAEWFPQREGVRERLMEWIKPHAVVGYGGSRTLEEIGILETLRHGDFHLLDRNRTDISQEQRRDFQLQALTADYFLSSVNAIALSGELVFIDGYGSRVAPILFGPKQVLLVAGINKVCGDLDQALSRAKNVASPLNAYRLQRKTPCVKTGFCQDCNSPERICNYTVVMEKNSVPERVRLLLVGEPLGF
jgi:hypothetical protein